MPKTQKQKQNKILNSSLSVKKPSRCGKKQNQNGKDIRGPVHNHLHIANICCFSGLTGKQNRQCVFIVWKSKNQKSKHTTN